VNAGHFVQNRGYRDRLGILGQHTYLRYGSPGPDRLQRVRQRTASAHLHHQVDAFAARLVQDPAIPLRMFAVVQAASSPMPRARSSLASLLEVPSTRNP